MLSAVILARKRENVPTKCLKSLSFCDEIKIIDTPGNFAERRNLGMNEASEEWILFIDTDEEVAGELADEIKTVTSDRLQVASNQKQSYYIKRRDFWWGRELKWGEDLAARNKGFIRLMKKNAGKWEGDVHETFKPRGQTGQLNGFINHYPHPTLTEFIADINVYSSLRADELFKMNKKTNIFQIAFYPISKFIYTYALLLGFLDGAAGFAYSFLLSFHSFLVRGKLYLKNS